MPHKVISRAESLFLGVVIRARLMNKDVSELEKYYEA